MQNGCYPINLGNHFSTHRLEPYKNLLKCGTDEEVLSAYFFMTEISSPLLTIIHILEITLRNRLNDFLRQKFNPFWFDSIPQKKSAELVSQAHSDLKKKKGRYTENDVVSNLDFGFWVYLLSPDYDGIWDSTAESQVFPHKGSLTLQKVFSKFRSAADIRNRLCHHEPMWKDKNIGGIKPDKILFKIKAKYEHLLSILEYISPQMCCAILSSSVLGFTDIDAHFELLHQKTPAWSKYLSAIGNLS